MLSGALSGRRRRRRFFRACSSHPRSTFAPCRSSRFVVQPIERSRGGGSCPSLAFVGHQRRCELFCRCSSPFDDRCRCACVVQVSELQAQGSQRSRQSGGEASLTRHRHHRRHAGPTGRVRESVQGASVQKHHVRENSNFKRNSQHVSSERGGGEQIWNRGHTNAHALTQGGRTSARV